MSYTPEFDTTIRTTTLTQRHNTMHTDKIDWSYPFAKHGGNEPRVETRKEYLRICERCATETVYAWSHGIARKVISVGMASAWPYWTPRPTVLVEGTLGVEWIDWWSLCGATVRQAEART